MNIKHQGSLIDKEKEFIKLFQELCYSRSDWQVWSDLMTTIACTISNAADRSPGHYEKREKEYADCVKRLGGMEIPAKIFAVIVSALEKNPNQDFLGALYMKLNLGDHWKGQFFTPYNVCELMARINLEGSKEQIEKKGWISISDMCIGGGAMLIASANVLNEENINFQNHVLFAGQDIDRTTALMAYIQLSLLGCPGYICVGDSLVNPMTGPVLMPAEKEGQELWYMPMFLTDVWQYRKIFYMLDGMTGSTKRQRRKEHKFVFFNFEKMEEYQNGSTRD